MEGFEAALLRSVDQALGDKPARNDVADYLKTEDDIAAYLEAVIDENGEDPALITKALGAVARAQNMSALARKVGVTREGLYKALSGEGNPSFATVLKLARAMGLQLTFRKARSEAVA